MAGTESIFPDYWLPQPEYALGEEAQRACDALLAVALAHSAAEPMDYTLAVPKWRFLCYVVEQHGLVLHGSPNGGITEFAPRKAEDFNDFGAQMAVYAAADGIWPIYFAIVDREKSRTIQNGCIWAEHADGTMGLPHYYFSISKNAVAQQPYRDGVVYLLPRASFTFEPPMQYGEVLIHSAQLASAAAVRPLAKLAVTPEDFPFLAQMRTHDDARLGEYAAAMQQGLPMPE